MKTEVIMKREIFGKEIKQKSKSEYFSATDLTKAGNSWRIANGLSVFNMSLWLKQEGVQDFIKTLEGREGRPVVVKSRGRNSQTWVHPYVFIDMALAISPKLKIEVYEWLYDHLLKYRNDSGDSYKKMAGSVINLIKNPRLIPEKIKEIANKIKVEVGVVDWQRATEEQLNLRNRIHENIALLCDVIMDLDKAVEIGIQKALDGK